MLRPLYVFWAGLTAAALAGVALAPRPWGEGNAMLVLVGVLAVAVIAFNWWELWSSRGNGEP